jgi:hypothetical protein
MFVPFYTILKQRLKIFWSSTPTNFSYEPPLLLTSLFVYVTLNMQASFPGSVKSTFSTIQGTLPVGSHHKICE